MKTHSGLTLIELLVTLAVLSILIAVAAPNFTGVTTSNRVTTELNGITGALTYARSEAITRNTPVYLTSFDSTISGTAPSGGSDWNTGWKVVAYDPDTTSLIELRQSGAVTSDVAITAGNYSVSFMGDGSSPDGVQFKFCPGGKQIAVSGTGRPFITASTGTCP